MRINNLVTSYLKCDNNLDKLKYMSNLNGGWERWFQLELAYYYAEKYTNRNGASKTEVKYDETSKRCDLAFSNATTNSIIYLEIKCQTTHQSILDFTKNLGDDFKKMKINNKPITVLGVFKECLKANEKTVLDILREMEIDIKREEILVFENHLVIILEKLASLK